jgi:DNA-binding NtrC family response regulator
MPGRAEMGKAKILLVDNEVAFANNIAKLIARRGYEIKTVQNGENAIKALSENEFDVMVLDSKIPGMNTMATLKKIREKSPEVEVIILTSQGSSDTTTGEVQLGVFDVIMKPVRFDDLFEKIKQAFQRKSLLGKNTK